MEDQATLLREMVHRSPAPPPHKLSKCQLIGVTSGKGGVGKTSVVVNLAMALRRSGHKVAIFDADFGLANVDVFLGLTPSYHIGHVISGAMPLKSIITEGPEGLHILPASSGIQELTGMGETRRERLIAQLDGLLDSYDYILIDTAAGISENVVRFLTVSRRVIVVSAPEPTAIVDAYALIKVLLKRDDSKEILVLINSVRGEEEAVDVFHQLAGVVERFLGQEVRLLGFVPRDEKMHQSVRKQEPILISYPKTAASRAFFRIARALQSIPPIQEMPVQVWRKMV
ncbi:MAG: MinD/ParA family protein [Acidobacteriota bacterium]